MFENLSEQATNKLLEELPAIKELVFEKVAPAVLETGVKYIEDDNRVKPVFETAYQFLPFAIRIMVKQQDFVDFCMARKKEILSN